MLSAGSTNYQRTDLHPILPLYLVIVTAFIGYGMMVTIFIPMLMQGSGFFDESVARSTRVIYSGVLLALYPLGQFLGAPVIGTFADKFGRKRVLMISLIFTIFFYAVISYSLGIHSLWLLMGACFLAGLTESNVAICQSAIADISLPEDRGRLFAYIYVSMSLGYITGPLIGGQIAVHFGFATPFWVVTALLVLVYIWVWKSFNDTYVPDPNKEISYFRSFTNLANVFTDLPIRKIYLVNFMIYFGLFGLSRVVQIYIIDEWNYTLDKITLYYAYISAVCAVSNFFLFAPLSRKFNLKSLTLWSSIIGGILIIAITIPKSDIIGAWVISALAFLVLMWAISGCGTYLSTLVSEDRQGRVMGNNLAIQVGAESIAAGIGGFLAAMLVPLPLLTYGVACVLGGLLLITYKKKEN